MKVKITSDKLAGKYNLCYGPGEVVDLPDAQARELIEEGDAVVIEFKPQSEKATSKVKPEKR